MSSRAFFISKPSPFRCFSPVRRDNYINGAMRFRRIAGSRGTTMDYEFLRDITGVVKVRMSMGMKWSGTGLMKR